jgi:hypothetical protein
VASPAISRCAGVVDVVGASCTVRGAVGTVLGAGVVSGGVDRDDKGASVQKPRANARTATTSLGTLPRFAPSPVSPATVTPSRCSYDSSNETSADASCCDNSSLYELVCSREQPARIVMVEARPSRPCVMLVCSRAKSDKIIMQIKSLWRQKAHQIAAESHCAIQILCQRDSDKQLEAWSSCGGFPVHILRLRDRASLF